MVEYKGKRVIVDFGEDWLGRLDDLAPHALVITHAHPDHAGGLQQGASCPVYATQAAWDAMEEFPIAQRERVEPRKAFAVDDIRFEAFPVDHSIRAPAVGYRITAGRPIVFYCPDVLYIHDRKAALSNVRLYVGDGATLKRSFVRKQDGVLIGHVPIRTQLTWCQKEGVSRAIFTHCGSEIVEGDERTLGAQLRRLAEERTVQAQLAHDGMEVILR